MTTAASREVARLRDLLGTCAQLIQNGSEDDTRRALCVMLDEADKGSGKVIWKYDPRPAFGWCATCQHTGFGPIRVGPETAVCTACGRLRHA